MERDVNIRAMERKVARYKKRKSYFNRRRCGLCCWQFILMRIAKMLTLCDINNDETRSSRMYMSAFHSFEPLNILCTHHQLASAHRPRNKVIVMVFGAVAVPRNVKRFEKRNRNLAGFLDVDLVLLKALFAPWNKLLFERRLYSF